MGISLSREFNTLNERFPPLFKVECVCSLNKEFLACAELSALFESK
jgi:hypothetical protein